MDISEKEMLIDELDEHLRQVRSCCVFVNPFIELPHPILFNAMSYFVTSDKGPGMIFINNEKYEKATANMLDKMMREIIDLR
jgi:hypothetical protein